MKRCLSLLALFTAPAIAGVFPDVGYSPPPGWNGQRFVLSQNYPQSEPPAEAYPWTSIDPKTEPQKYLNAVIDYCFEGFLQGDQFLQPQANTQRLWVHAPWMHYGRNSREFVNGMTAERVSRPNELSELQSQSYRNFAVGVYNDRAGYAIGQVWKNPTEPNPSAAQFPEGSVGFKLLFTTAPESIGPWMAGSPTWVADIDRSQDPQQIAASKVRLLQIDIAVKDSRSNCGGWIFGTFHYDASIQAASPWRKLRPLTLLWGNDPTLTAAQAAAGTKPTESWVDPESPIVKFRANPPAGLNPPAPSVMGWAGRGNGPVDNPLSSCLSCHSTAQVPATKMMPPNNATDQTRLRWFRNLAPGQAFNSNAITLEFSLQLAVGMQNLADFKSFTKDLGGFFVAPNAAPPNIPGAGAPAAMPMAAPKKPSPPRYGRDQEE